MNATRLCLPFLVLTVWIYIGVICDSNNVFFNRFTREEFFDGSICPDGNVIKNTNRDRSIKCLTLCTKHSLCHGVFFEPDARRCVMCSAKSFMNTTSIVSKFYKRHGFSTYLLVEQPMKWDTAKQNCENIGGHLAIITSEEENNYIVQLVNASVSIEEIYIGGKGLGGQAETFEWVDGSALQDGYTNWMHNQPNPHMDSERYIAMKRNSHFQWEDEKKEYSSICEFD